MKDLKFLNSQILIFSLVIISSCNKDSSPEEKLKASFTMDKTNARVEETIFFTNTSQYGTSFAWDFGDESLSTEENPTHNYSNIGDYKITLAVNGEKGIVSTANSITIWDILIKSTYFGESIKYEGPTIFQTQTIKFQFHNESPSLASANLVKHNDGYTHKDMRDTFDDGISYGHHPDWTTEIIGPWNLIDAGKTHTWMGKLEPGLYTLVSARDDPFCVWYVAGLSVSY